MLEGLTDAPAEASLLARVRRGLLLHGHLHRRIHRKLGTDRGHVDAVGATSASLLHESDERMAGFNVYELDDDGAVRSLESLKMKEEGETFHEVSIPRS
jgi:hypothetical protein